MSDYYPPLARAIAGLDLDAPGESRRALYDRARTALIAQLRSMQPPLLETEITRERSSLEEAIRKVESEAANPYRQHFSSDEDGSFPAGGESDPLAELARLIGQTDPFGTMGRASVEPEDSAPSGPPPWIRRANRQEVYEEPEPEQDYEPSPVHPLHRDTARHQFDSPPYQDAVYSQPAASEEVEGQEGLEEGEASKPNPKLSLPPISTLPEQNEKKAIAFRPSRRGPLELL